MLYASEFSPTLLVTLMNSYLKGNCRPFMIKSTINFTCELEAIFQIHLQLRGTKLITCHRAESHFVILCGYYLRRLLLLEESLGQMLTSESL